jgi:hypothetical protein
MTTPSEGEDGRKVEKQAGNVKDLFPKVMLAARKAD